MSDSPRTDAIVRAFEYPRSMDDLDVMADFARARERELAESERRNFDLAAGQCIVDGGLVDDDYGHQYCRLAREHDADTKTVNDLRDRIAALEARLAEREKDLQQCAAETLDREREKLLAMTIEQLEDMRRMQGHDPNDEMVIAQQAETIALLTHELDAALKDAERYRWLRSHYHSSGLLQFELVPTKTPLNLRYEEARKAYEDSLNAAIDAARAAKEEGEK